MDRTYPPIVKPDASLRLRVDPVPDDTPCKLSMFPRSSWLSFMGASVAQGEETNMHELAQ